MEELREEVHKRSNAQILFQISPSYRRLFPQLLEKVCNSFHAKKGLASLDLNTSRRFLRQWTRNAFRLAVAQGSLNFISGAAQPEDSSHSNTRSPLVIYCGADPRLLEDLRSLGPHLLSKGVFLIASDSALGPLLASQYSVDLAICVDSGAASLYHLHAADHFKAFPFAKKKFRSDSCSWNFPVLTWSGGLPGLEFYFSKLYYYRSTLPFDQVLAMGPLAKIIEWQNTARNPLGLALYIAYFLGAKELYCAGTSFRTYKRKSHERGTGYQEYILGQTKRTFSLEMYKPLGYQEKEGSEKENWNWQGALKLASRLGLELKKIRSSDPEDLKKKLCSLPSPSISNSELWEKKISILNIPTREIRSFLAKQKSLILFSQLEELGLEKELWSTYLGIL